MLSTVAAPLYIPTSSAQMFQLLHIFAIFCLFDSNHPNKCEVASLLLSLALNFLDSPSADICDLIRS